MVCCMRLPVRVSSEPDFLESHRFVFYPSVKGNEPKRPDNGLPADSVGLSLVLLAILLACSSCPAALCYVPLVARLPGLRALTSRYSLPDDLLSKDSIALLVFAGRRQKPQILTFTCDS